MAIVPAVGLGFVIVVFIAFGVGVIATEKVIDKIEGMKKEIPLMRRESLTSKWTAIPPSARLSEKTVDSITYTIGGIAAVAAIFLLIFVLREWTIVAWYGLTAIGFIAGFLTFYLR